MAYNSRNLSALSYANGFTLWHYRTPDTDEDLLAPGYFDDAAKMFRAGDVVIANTAAMVIPQQPAIFLTVTDNSAAGLRLARCTVS